MKREELDALWNDNSHWRFYLSIYRCPQDPRIFIKKRDTAGWTVNFSHPAGIPIFILMMVTTLLLPFAVMIFWRDDRVGVAATLGLMALVLAMWVAISIWNERREY